MMHCNLRSSYVRVPVLSKTQVWIFPAKSIRCGSVQNIRFLLRYYSDVLIAMFMTMGSSVGTTFVIMVMHLRKSLFLLRSGSSSPLIRTYTEEMIETMRRSISKKNESFWNSFWFSSEYKTVLASFPFVVWNPVFKTTPITFSWGLSVFTERRFVPAKIMLFLCSSISN